MKSKLIILIRSWFSPQGNRNCFDLNWLLHDVWVFFLSSLFDTGKSLLLLQVLFRMVFFFFQVFFVLLLHLGELAKRHWLLPVFPPQFPLSPSFGSSHNVIHLNLVLYFLHFVLEFYEVEVSLSVSVVEKYYIFFNRILYRSYNVGEGSLPSVNFIEFLVLFVEKLLPSFGDHILDFLLQPVLEVIFF